jgi:hypothetical protein
MNRVAAVTWSASGEAMEFDRLVYVSDFPRLV